MQKIKNSIYILLLFYSNVLAMQVPYASDLQNKKPQPSKEIGKKALRLGIRSVFNGLPLLCSFGKPLLSWALYSLLNNYKNDPVLSDYSLGLKFEELQEKQQFDEETVAMFQDTLQKIAVDSSQIRFLGQDQPHPNTPDIAFLTASIDHFGQFNYGSFFKIMPLIMKQFVFAHELIHFKENHAWKRISFNLASPFIAAGSLYIYSWLSNKFLNYIKKENKLDDNRFFSAFVLLHNHIATSGLLHLFITETLQSKFSQHLEYRADIGAVTALNDALGGMQFMAAMDKLKSMPELNKGVGFSFFELYHKFFPEHPSDLARLKYLLKFHYTIKK